MKGKKENKIEEKIFSIHLPIWSFTNEERIGEKYTYRQLSDSDYTKSQTGKLQIISHWYDKNNSYRVF